MTFDKAATKRWRKNNPDKIAQYARDRRRRQKEAAAGSVKSPTCHICETDGVTVFDHCHTTKKFRGWLCHRCNVTLGAVKDDPELLGKMATYLRAHA